jgi:hypothetical protein
MFKNTRPTTQLIQPFNQGDVIASGAHSQRRGYTAKTTTYD